MKKYYSIYLLIILVMMSCSDDNDNDNGSDDINSEQNIYKTGVDLSLSSFVNWESPDVNNTYFMLGYGYDMTGKYAHPGWIKSKVVDIDKYEAMYPTRITRKGYFMGYVGHRFDCNSDKDMKFFSIRVGFTEEEAVEYKNLFKETLALPFKNDTSFTDLNYGYSGLSQLHSWYAADLWEDFIENDNLTDEFKKDLNAKDAHDIIKLYGTHILIGVVVGERMDYLYRISSKDNFSYGLDKRLINAIPHYFSTLPGIFTDKPEENLTEKENLYIEVMGGEVSNPNSWMIDITNYTGERIVYDGWNKLSDSNLTLIDFPGYKPIPIYEVVSDPIKKEELRKAYEKYLSE